MSAERTALTKHALGETDDRRQGTSRSEAKSPLALLTTNDAESKGSTERAARTSRSAATINESTA
jgi:hypothetical protein